MRLFIASIFLAFAILTGCSAMFLNYKSQLGYNFEKPNQSIKLPPILHEISGLTCLTDSKFACIQDENGVVFIFDTQKKNIVEQQSFHLNGDYEGITLVENSLYILRSDGTIFEILNFETDTFKVTEYTTMIPANNNEGLCYDPQNHCLLIACKGKIGKGPEYKDKRVIYAFNLESKKLSDDPVFEFSLNDIKQKAKELGINKQSSKKKKASQNGPDIKFHISAIGIHPITQNLFVLSAVDHLLFVFDRNGSILHMKDLDPELFNKAEGIAFLPNGDLFITNEGQDKKPTLHSFTFQNR